MQFEKPGDAELRRALTPLQYEVTQHDATERPFANEFWDNHQAGIYVDVVSGEPLFSSLDKFESGTGWPSFTKPLEPANVHQQADRSLLSVRTEVRSAHGDSHLGHVFDDGPPPSGLRYCMNSAALRFIPVERLDEAGDGQYLRLFQTTAGKDAPHREEREGNTRPPWTYFRGSRAGSAAQRFGGVAGRIRSQAPRRGSPGARACSARRASRTASRSPSGSTMGATGPDSEPESTAMVAA